MKEKIYKIAVNILVFWVVIDFFSGITVKEGLLGYLVCGGIFGLAMLIVAPLIRFFTLPVKFITLFLIGIMVSIMIFFIMSVGVFFIDFSDGTIVGLDNRYFEFPKLELSMMGNVFVGGSIGGILSALMESLSDKS